MSTYGPPGGPYPGQPQDPWQSGEPVDPYGQTPVDPYSQPPVDPYGRTWPQPAHGWDQPGEPWRPPVAPPPRRRTSGVLITLVVVLAVLLCGGAGIAIWAATRNKPAADPAASRAAAPTAGATAATNDTLTAKVGDCLANEGSPQVPKLRKVTCAAGSFQVIARLEETSDVGRCTAVAGYTHNYYYKTASEKTSFVLCMRQR